MSKSNRAVFTALILLKVKKMYMYKFKWPYREGPNYQMSGEDEKYFFTLLRKQEEGYCKTMAKSYGYL